MHGLNRQPPSAPLPPSPANGASMPDVPNWNSHQVCEWLEKSNFGQFVELFLAHDITGDVLIDLNYSLLKEIGVTLVGDRARILAAIKRNLKSGNTSIVTDTYSLGPLSPKLEERRPPQMSSPERPQKNRFPGMSPGSPDAPESDHIGVTRIDSRTHASPTTFMGDGISPTGGKSSPMVKNRNNMYPSLAPRSSSIKESKQSPSSAKSDSGDIHSVRYVSIFSKLISIAYSDF